MSSRSGSASRFLTTVKVISVIATLSSGGDVCFCAGPWDSTTIAGGLHGAVSFCVAPSGTIYVVEAARDRVARISPDGRREAETGGYGWREGGFDGPTDIAGLDDLEIFVADRGNDRIVRLDRTLGIASVFETRSESVTFRFPQSIALTESGTLLVVDAENGRIVELGREERVTRLFGGAGTGRGFLRAPSKVRTDGASRVVVRDESGLVVFDQFGNQLRRLPKAATGEFISHDVDRDGILLLDSAGIRFLSFEGTGRARAGFARPPGAGGPVELRSAGGRVYVLFPDRIIAIPAAVRETADPGMGRRPD